MNGGGVRTTLVCMLLMTANICFAQHREEDLQAHPGASLYSSGRFAEARNLLESEIAANRATPSTFFWLGYTYLALNERERAIPHFERYLRDDPGNEDVLYALAKT